MLEIAWSDVRLLIVGPDADTLSSISEKYYSIQLQNYYYSAITFPSIQLQNYYYSAITFPLKNSRNIQIIFRNPYYMWSDVRLLIVDPGADTLSSISEKYIAGLLLVSDCLPIHIYFQTTTSQ